jgi:hypothetical protein
MARIVPRVVLDDDDREILRNARTVGQIVSPNFTETRRLVEHDDMEWPTWQIDRARDELAVNLAVRSGQMYPTEAEYVTIVDGIDPANPEQVAIAAAVTHLDGILAALAAATPKAN